MSGKITPQEIRAIIESAGLSRAQAAAAVGVTEVTIWRWLEGRSSPHSIFVRELKKIQRQNNKAGS